MCVVSMIADGYPWRPHPRPYEPYRPKEPWPDIVPIHPTGPFVPSIPIPVPLTDAEKQELEELRALKKLLDAAREYDRITGQPDCESPEKMKKLTDILKRLEALEDAVKK